MQNYFSTNWQRVIFRNYGLVPTENIAKALKTDAQTIKLEAERLGLKKVEYNPDWLKKGYVTIKNMESGSGESVELTLEGILAKFTC